MPNGALESLRDKRSEQGDRSNVRTRGRGSVVNYYKDLGFSTTQPAYEKWRAEEDIYQTSKARDYGIINKNKSIIAQAENEYNNYQLKLPELQTDPDKYYQEHKSSLLPVKVVDLKAMPNAKNQPSFKDGKWGYWDVAEVGKYGVIITPDLYEEEATYYLPQDAISKMEGIRTYTGKNGELLVSTVSKGPNKTIGDKLHEAFGNAQEEYASKYKSAVSSQLSSAIDAQNQQTSAFDTEKQKAWNQISSAKAELTAAEESLKATEALRSKQMSTLRGNYQKKINTLKEIFGGE